MEVSYFLEGSACNDSNDTHRVMMAAMKIFDFCGLIIWWGVVSDLG